MYILHFVVVDWETELNSWVYKSDFFGNIPKWKLKIKTQNVEFLFPESMSQV